MLEHWPQGLQIGLPKCNGILFFQPWGRYKAIKFSNLGQIEKIFYFFLSALTPSVKPLGLISTFAPIGMVELD
jgi:hypothetical protein